MAILEKNLDGFCKYRGPRQQQVWSVQATAGRLVRVKQRRVGTECWERKPQKQAPRTEGCQPLQGPQILLPVPWEAIGVLRYAFSDFRGTDGGREAGRRLV